MTAFTVQLPDETADLLRAQPDAQEIAARAIIRALRTPDFVPDAPPTWPALSPEQDAAELREGVAEGFADLKAGRTVSLDEEQIRWRSQKADLLSRK